MTGRGIPPLRDRVLAQAGFIIAGTTAAAALAVLTVGLLTVSWS
ncbi:hypothetical protein WDU99_01705 [Microbacterium sp. Mu-80]|uniref:Uncharacterized protein n=1 Tax=Microbacterium bandirmense TaxID=3122050 RepID=A0ABU8L9K2_9MICO